LSVSVWFKKIWIDKNRNFSEPSMVILQWAVIFLSNASAENKKGCFKGQPFNF
jgi:hypothetical protein